MSGTHGTLVYRTTDGLEIENMIPETVLQLALPKLIQRGDQTAIAQIAVREADYRATPLGQYLRERLGPACPDTLVAQGGTLASYYKDKLASIVAELVPEAVRWEALSPPIQRLTEELYAFIARHNP
jgi:hypothetical protein